MGKGRHEDGGRELSGGPALHRLPPASDGRTSTVAELIEQALYHPAHGYYSTNSQRSGRRGDFITSVDAGPLFGATIAVQLAEMCARIGDTQIDLVEAGAGNGRLTRDILDTLAAEHPGLYARVRVTLVDRSGPARLAAAERLRRHAARVVAIRPDLPGRICGVVLANELLDALPVHVLAKTGDGMCEIYVRRRGDRLEESVGPLSDPRLAEGLEADGLPDGWRGERSLAVRGWITDTASRLERGYLLLFDYVTSGHSETLTAYSRHTASRRWSDAAGSRDITAHVDLADLRRVARTAGLVDCGCVDQTYFLLALGLLDRLALDDTPSSTSARLAAKTLILPGGMGSTMKAIAFAAHVDGAGLRGFAGGRLT